MRYDRAIRPARPRPSTRALRNATASVIESLEQRRLLSAGTPDSSFGTGGFVRTDFLGHGSDVARGAVAVGGGSVVTVGESDNQVVIARYTAGGSLDTSFGTG